MTDGWFAGLDPDDVDGAARAIRDGTADEPAEWPETAVEDGFAPDEEGYYEHLRRTAVTAARRGVRESERADDRQLVHAVRAMDDCDRTANELAERVAEWATSRFDDAGTGVEYARQLANQPTDTDHSDAGDERLVSLAGRVDSLADEAAATRSFITQTAPDVAPNLAALAGPILTARLIERAGGLHSLAKKPSGTVQVLGAEDALFAHLRGQAPSPKHGVIFTHEAVRGTHPDDRGSAARALAGKLTIAARVDYYSGDYRPELEAQLAERIETIQSRTADGEGA